MTASTLRSFANTMVSSMPWCLLTLAFVELLTGSSLPLILFHFTCHIICMILFFHRSSAPGHTNFTSLTCKRYSKPQDLSSDLGTPPPSHRISPHCTRLLACYFFGLHRSRWYCNWPCFSLPLPVQTMKAIASVAVSRNLLFSRTIRRRHHSLLCQLILSVMGLLSRCSCIIPNLVFKDIEFSTGLSLTLSTGLTFLSQEKWMNLSWRNIQFWTLFACFFLLVVNIPYASRQEISHPICVPYIYSRLIFAEVSLTLSDGNPPNRTCGSQTFRTLNNLPLRRPHVRAGSCWRL